MDFAGSANDTYYTQAKDGKTVYAICMSCECVHWDEQVGGRTGVVDPPYGPLFVASPRTFTIRSFQFRLVVLSPRVCLAAVML